MAVLIAVLIGTVVGVINGLLVILLDVPSIIAYIGTMYAVRGAAWVITGGNSVSRGLSRDFTVLGPRLCGADPPVPADHRDHLPAVFPSSSTKTLLANTPSPSAATAAPRC